MSEFDYNLNPGDLGHRMLESVFGSSWDNMFATGPTGSMAEMISAIFYIFNSTVVLATAIIVGYTLWSGTVQTAHEGKSLGKRYSSLWTPLRMAAGAALTAPVFGISMVQMMVLAVTGFSFHVANNVSGELTSFLSRGGSISVQDPYAGPVAGYKLASALAMSETCAEYRNVNEGYLENAGNMLSWGVVSPAWKEKLFEYGPSGFWRLSDRNCGSVEVKYSGDHMDIIKAGVDGMAASIRPAAQAIVRNDEEIPGSHFSSAMALFDATRASLLERANSQASTKSAAAAEKIQSDIASAGWIALGAWYYQIMLVSAERAQATHFDIDIISPAFNEVDSDVGAILTYVNKSGRYVSDSASALSGHTINPVAWQDETNAEIFLTSAIDLVQGEGDPFLKVVALGQNAMTYGIGLAATGKLTEWVGSAIGGKDSKVPLADKVTGLGSIMSWLGMLLVLVGAWLGWYLPILPFINWSVGVIGVFIAIVQSLFASQIWAAAHAMPEGEGIAGTHAKQGYMLLISLALRPILIVMGFVFSYFLLWMGCHMTIAGLRVYLPTIYSGGNPVSVVVGALVGFIVAAIMVTTILHRALGFIFESADDILTWIGGGRQLGSEQSTIQKAVGAFAMIVNRGGALRGASRGIASAVGGKGGAKVPGGLDAARNAMTKRVGG